MPMRIRELAARAGTTTRALRYYEEQGLLSAARMANGYRAYDESHVRLVREIRSLQSIGFSLEDVRPFVECLVAGHGAGDECPASVEVYRRKLEYLDQHIDELTGVRDRLAARLAEIAPSAVVASSSSSSSSSSSASASASASSAPEASAAASLLASSSALVPSSSVPPSSSSISVLPSSLPSLEFTCRPFLKEEP